MNRGPHRQGRVSWCPVLVLPEPLTRRLFSLPLYLLITPTATYGDA